MKTPQPFSAYDRARLREGMLWLGFLLVLVAAVLTVAIPELSKEPEEGHAKPGNSTPAPPTAPAHP
jgi:hypothetical protein